MTLASSEAVTKLSVFYPRRGRWPKPELLVCSSFPKEGFIRDGNLVAFKCMYGAAYILPCVYYWAGFFDHVGFNIKLLSLDTSTQKTAIWPAGRKKQ